MWSEHTSEDKTIFLRLSAVQMLTLFAAVGSGISSTVDVRALPSTVNCILPVNTSDVSCQCEVSPAVCILIQPRELGWVGQGLTSYSTHFRSFRRRWVGCGISQDCSRSQSPQCVRCWVVCARPLLITVVCMCIIWKALCPYVLDGRLGLWVSLEHASATRRRTTYIGARVAAVEGRTGWRADHRLSIASSQDAQPLHCWTTSATLHPTIPGRFSIRKPLCLLPLACFPSFLFIIINPFDEPHNRLPSHNAHFLVCLFLIIIIKI